MKWKNVLKLINVNIKSGRLIRGQKLRRYRESRVIQYVMYGGSCLLGIAIGLYIGTFYGGITNPEMKIALLLNAKNFFIATPTLVLTYSLIFTMMRQIQSAGVKASIQPPYWLPITWGEHTLAAISANLLGIQLAILIFIVSAISIVSIFIGETLLATLTIFAILVIALLASTTTEIFRVLQVRLTGAVFKTSGKAAIWVRFFGSILLFIAFYVIYFFFTSGVNFFAIVEALASGHMKVWFIPYLWLGMTIFYFINGQIIETIVFCLGSVAFLSALFAAAIILNSRFGIYETPAIRISTGTYAPQHSVWRKAGFSLPEAAIMRKDFRAFTRRRELIFIFVLPVVIVIMWIIPLMQTPYFQALSGFSAFILLIPGALMATSMGSMIIGQEGSSVWHLYSSPITAKSLIKCKYAFVVVLSCAVMLASSAFSILIIHPSLKIIFATLIESIFLIISLSAVSLRAAIRGASFTEIPRPRMIRPKDSIINLVVCLILSSVILAPLFPYAFTMFGLINPLPQFYLYIALTTSGIIASILTYGFYKIALKNAKNFLAKAEI